MNALIDLTGHKFGRLTVTKLVKRHRIFWECLCDCGNSCTVVAHRLTSGETQSCGCIRKESLSKISKKFSTLHGHNAVGKQTRTHKTWIAMMHRCHCETSADYPMYGVEELLYVMIGKNTLIFTETWGIVPKESLSTGLTFTEITSLATVDGLPDWNSKEIAVTIKGDGNAHAR